MTWLTPWTGLLVLAGVLPPLLALYFLRLRRARMVVPSTMLWIRAVEDLRANAPFQRLRFSILLLLQLIALALIVLAIMQPQADIGERRGGRTVFLIDNSASMNTSDEQDGATRLEAAKARALDRLNSIFGGGWFSGPSGQVMIVAFASGAEVIAPYTDSHEQAAEALKAIKPTDEITNIGEGLELARAFSQSGDASSGRRQVESTPPAPPRFEVFSDGRISDLRGQVLNPGEQLIYQRVGSTETPNAGVVVVGLERDPRNPDRVQVYGRIANFGTAPATVDVQLVLDGVVRAVSPEPLVLPGAREDAQTKAWIAGEGQVSFPALALPAGGIAEVTLARHDLFATDDAARLVAPPAKAMRVLLVTDGGFLMKSLLEGMPIASLEVVSSQGFVQMTEEGELPFDVVVADSASLPTLPPGRYLIFGSPPPLPDLNPYGDPQAARLRGSVDEHPLLRFARVDDLTVGKLNPIAPSGRYEVIAESGSGPLILTLNQGGIRAVIVPFDPLDSNWPFLRSFVNFVANSIDWLGAGGEAAISEAGRPGGVLTARLPANATGILMRDAEGKEKAISSSDPSMFTYGPVLRAGVYALSWQDGAKRDGRSFAVNVDARAEGRVGAAEELVLQEDRVRGVGAAGSVRTSFWPWALVATLVVLLLEWILYFKRV